MRRAIFFLYYIMQTYSFIVEILKYKNIVRDDYRLDKLIAHENFKTSKVHSHKY